MKTIGFIQLAINYQKKYEQLGEIDDLNEAIDVGREALSLCTPGYRYRSMSLSNLALSLSSRYEQLGRIDDLNEAIVLNQEALSLRPPGHSDRLISFINLSKCLTLQYQLLGEIDDLNRAIVLDREALSICPPRHPYRPMSLSNLATYLSSRYERLGGIDDLNEAIRLSREALSLCPPGHPHRAMSFISLGKCLMFQYRLLGQIDDLNEAIVFCREALSICPPGHPHRPMALSNLAGYLSFQYEQLGGIDDLDEAIVMSREALLLRPPGHPDRPMSFINLAKCLSSRYDQLGGIDDLNEAIDLDQEALSIHSAGHPNRSMSLNNLATDLSSRYAQLREIDDLNKAIVLAKEALSLCSPGHPGRSMSLMNLAVQLSMRYDQLRTIDDFDEAIVLDREAVALCPPGHPDRSKSLNNLAIHLSSRYEQLGEIDDLNEAIVLGREALLLCPPEHPDRSLPLNNLAIDLSSRYKHFIDIVDLNAAYKDKQELFTLYTELEHAPQPVSSAGLTTVKAWIKAAEEFNHPSTLPAYETALRLLVQHSAALPALPHHLDLVKSLSSSLAVDAFSACLRNQSLTKAVELLEQGRAVFWSQLTRLRSPLDKVIKSGPQGKVLADEFIRLTSLVRNALNLPGPYQHDRVCRLNLELQSVVSKIRELSGLSRFLLPSLFTDLQRAARDGPVIIMNASKYGCDALVVFADKDPVRIPLSVTKEDVRGLSLRLRTLTRGAKRMDTNDIEKEFKTFLRELWDKVASHIINVLQTTCPRNSRIWWCPTAEFSLLPLHAAAPYRKHQKGVSDLYVSSYTTTLTALIRARQPSSPNSTHDRQRFIAIGQASAKDANELIHVGTELDNIGRLVGGLAAFTRIEGEHARISNVADQLAKNEWVHLACHGIPSQERPFESAFALHDGRFTIQHITQCDLQDPKIAYLSACHTTVGDKESPDEVIHLAAAMQFAGFRSVIGTMWAVDDSQTNEVISSFYNLMIDDSGRLDYTRAARALRMTMKKVDIRMDQRILYIHLGA